MVTSAPADGVRVLAENVVGRTGLVVEEVTVTSVGRRRLLRITVDLPEDRTGGVPMDAVAQASQVISAALDESDVMGGAPYVLEVSSPGIGRPLTERRHFSRARGRIVSVTTTGPAPVRGRLTEVDDAGLGFEDGTRVGWDVTIRGVVEIEFNRPDGAGDEPDLEDDAGEGEED